jgi:transcription antitermination protein NusB
VSKGGNRGRSRARHFAVQALYQWQLAGHRAGDIVSEFLAERQVDGIDSDYFSELVRGVERLAGELEARLAPRLGRSFSALDPVERAVLMVGAFELGHHLEVPARVIINEGVELAKVFGGTDSHRFVNGALDRLAHDLRSAEFRAAGA